MPFIVYKKKINGLIILNRSIYQEKLTASEKELFLDEFLLQWEKFKIFLHWIGLILKNFEKGYSKSILGESFMILREQIFKLNK